MASGAPNSSARSRACRTSGPRCTATTAPTTSTVADVRRTQELLAEGKKFSDFQLRTIDNSFGSWFAFDEHGAEAPPPSETKTSIAVWVGLYPTVVLLTLALSPLKMPMWLGMLIGNLLSSFVMSFVTMPYYVNPLLKHWLRPPPDVPKARDELAGHRHRRRAHGCSGWSSSIWSPGCSGTCPDASGRPSGAGPVAPAQRRQCRYHRSAPTSFACRIRPGQPELPNLGAVDPPPLTSRSAPSWCWWSPP